jgi:xylulokinase
VLPDRPARAPRAVVDVPPAEACVLGVDLGTGGAKAAVVSATGMLVAHAFEPVDLVLTPDGGAEQDPDGWWSAVVLAARRALADSEVPPEQVIGVGCTAQWSGTVAVDADGRALGRAIIWMDSRGSAAVRRVVRGPVNALGYDVRKVPRWIHRAGGVPSLSGKDPVGHILFLRDERPEIYGPAAVFLEPVDYLDLRLTGLARASFGSIALHWVTDNRRIDRVAYDPDLLAMAGLDRSRLPELVPTGAILAGLADGAAAELGLLPGTPVVAGTGDLHSAAVGSGAVADLAGHLYIGTSSWISGHVPFKKTSAATNVTAVPSGLPGRYLVADEHETGGACLTWLRDQLFDGAVPDPGGGPRDGSGQPDAVHPNGETGDAFDRLNRWAATVPAGSGGVLFTPWLNGERSPVDDHTIRAGFHNLSLSTTRAEMVRAVFEGVAFNSRWLLGAVERFVGRPFDSLAFVGGGARSDLWAQVHADVTGRAIRQVADPVLANVRGAALLTLLALGRIRVDEVPGMVPVRATYRPDRSTAPVYDEMAAEFVRLYKRTKGIHRRLNRRPR